MHRQTSNLKNLEGLDVEFFCGDILDTGSLHDACKDVRWVYHAASQSAYWRDPSSVKETAVDGTRNLAEAALTAGVERLIFTSSLSAMWIPEKGELLTEEHTFNQPEKRFPYGAAKWMAEQHCSIS